MSGYLQRLLDTAAPASEPPALTPVVKSTSPIFDQNQLPGLAGLYGGEGEAEVALRVGDEPGIGAAGASTPLPPAPAPAIPTPETTRRDPLPVTSNPSPRPAVGGPAAESPPWSTVDATSPLPQEPPDTALERAHPDFKIIEPSPRLETVPLAEPLRVTDVPATLMVGSATHNARREVAPIGPVSDALLRPGMLEPRRRPDFDAGDPDDDQPRPEPQQAPRITIGRVTVTLEPDPGPAARTVRAARTAATASVIGPLGNRRARRRLFALARL